MSEKTKNSGVYFPGLNSLRAIAFLGVFLSHTGIRAFSYSGGAGVSIFLVMSGFLLMYRSMWGGYSGDKISLRGSIGYAVSKIQKLYPLHIITTLAMIWFSVAENSIWMIIGRFFLNCTLFQEWIPLAKRSINNVSWYLCVIAFCYFCFPLLCKVIKKREPAIFRCKTVIFLLIIVQAILCFGSSKLPELQNTKYFLKDLSLWIKYYHPITRLFDFASGCLIGYTFWINDKNIKGGKGNIIRLSRTRFSVYEVVAIIISIMIQYINTECYYSNGEKSFWWMNTTVFLPMSIILVVLFANSKGIISERLNKSRIIDLIGDVSNNAFLIHFVVLNYLSRLLRLFMSINLANCVVLIVGLPITIILSDMWRKILIKIPINLRKD